MPRGSYNKRSSDPNPGGSSGTASLAFANVAEMSAYNAALLTKGNVAEVLSLGELYLYDPTSTLAVSGLRVVAATGPGRWVRTYQRNPRWLDRAVWFVGPGGNDEADGATNATRLLTWAELMWRLQGEPGPAAGSGYDVMVTGALAGAPIVIDLRALSGVEAMLVHGPLALAYAGSCTARVNYADATGIVGTLTDAAIPVSWTASGLVGKLCIVTAGPRTGTRFWIMEDMGARTARISQPMAGAFGFSTTPGTIEVGDAFEVYNLVQLGSTVSVISAGGESQQVDFQYLELGTPGVVHAVEVKSGGSLIDSCFVHGFDSSGGAEPDLYNCRSADGLRSQHGASTTLFAGYCDASAGLQARACSILGFLNFVSYSGLTVEGAAIARTLDTSWIAWIGVASAATVQPGGVLDVATNGAARLWGVGVAAASTVFSVLGNGAIYFTSAKAPVFAGAAADVLLGGLTRTFAQLPYTEPISGAAMLDAAATDWTEDQFLALAADITIAAAPYADMLSLTFNVNGSRDVLVDTTWSVFHLAASVGAIRITVDGVPVVAAGVGSATAIVGAYAAGSLRWRANGLGAGAHTIKLQWSAGAGTLFCRPVAEADHESATMTIRELYG